MQAPTTTLAILGVVLMVLLVLNSSERLEDEFEKFIENAICVAKNGNTKGQKIFLPSFPQKEKGVDCHEFKDGIS